jgi:hypothetical protein
LLDGFEGGFTDGNNAFLRAFAEHADGFVVGINVTDIECGEFAQTKTAGIKKFENGGVAPRHPGWRLLLRFRRVRSVQQRFDLHGGEEDGQAFVRFG